MGCNSSESLFFKSDKKKGIFNASNRVFPLLLKRYCYRHIYANIKNKFPSLLLKKVFWRAYKSYNATDFNSHMDELKTVAHDGYEWFLKFPTVC